MTAGKALLVLAFVLLFGTGLVLAIGNATSSTATQSRWAGGGAAGSVATEGGNITSVNISSTSLTDRWASFYGNVTGSLRLWDGTNTVYSWSWAPASGGEVCLSTGNFAFATSSTATAANINTVWGFSGATDNATNTLTDADSACDLTFYPAVSVTDTTGVMLQGSSTFRTCAIDDGSTAAKSNFAFCTLINNAGKNYKNETANFEVMVPTDASTASATETYYFYLELN